MANLTLELNINSANNLLNVNLFTKMDVYAAITIHGENTRKKQKARTSVDRSGGSNPIWNQSVKFSINEKLVRDGRSTLVMRLISRRVLGNKGIGGVNIPLIELLNSITPSINGENNSQEMKLMTYQVRTASGKRSGFLTFSYRFKPNWPVIINRSSVETAANPPLSPIAHPPSAPPELPIEFPKLSQSPYLLKHPFDVGSSNCPLPISYNAVMTEQTNQADNHYTPPPPSHQGYGTYDFAPLSPMGFGYGSPSYQHQKEIGLGLGLGAGLLGGLMMGDIVSDVANCFDL